MNVAMRNKVKKLKIGTWNVKSIYEAGKIHNVLQEMQRLNVNIMGLSETRWPNTGELNIKNTKIYYSGNDSSQHWNGVAIAMEENLSRCVTGFVPISDRVIMIRMERTGGNMNIIQTYAPTADKDEDEVEQFYNDVQKALDTTKSRDITVVMGDFN